MTRASTSLPDYSINLKQRDGSHPAFGERFAVSVNTTVDAWGGVAATRPLPLAPKPMFVRSSSAADTFGGAGTQLLLVSFIDEFGDWRNSDLLVMDGPTNVPITYKPDDGILGNASRMPRTPSPPSGESQVASIFRVQDAVVALPGAATEVAPRVNNVGIIRVVDGPGTVFEVIPAGIGRSRSACFHCPRNHKAKLKEAIFAAARGAGRGYIATTFGLGTTWDVIPLAAVSSSTAEFRGDPATTPISPRADVQGVVTTITNDVDMTFSMLIRLQPAT